MEDLINGEKQKKVIERWPEIEKNDWHEWKRKINRHESLPKLRFNG
jgi:hypothetical protein